MTRGTGIDLGSGVYLRWVAWAPDHALNPHYAHLADEERNGIIVGHIHADGEVCEGFVGFDTPANRDANERARAAGKPVRPLWTVEGWDPLTISPSVLMSPDKGGCGLHGFIRAGRWSGA